MRDKCTIIVAVIRNFENCEKKLFTNKFQLAILTLTIKG